MFIRNNVRLFIMIFVVALICLPSHGVAADQPLVEIQTAGSELIWIPLAEGEGMTLTIGSPSGIVEYFRFNRGVAPTYSMVGPEGLPREEGLYSWEVVMAPTIDPAIKEAMREARERGDEAGLIQLQRQAGIWRKSFIQSGHFRYLQGRLYAGNSGEFEGESTEAENDGRSGRDVQRPSFEFSSAFNEVAENPMEPITNSDSDGSGFGLRDYVINDDLIVDGSACIGFDCASGESFGFDTLRLKENNLRIKFDDTSNSASFPLNDWTIMANDSTNGGLDRFSIEDVTGGRYVTTVEAGAPSNSIYVDDSGRVGFGTNSPYEELHAQVGDTPGIRLEQTSASGWAPQTWDIAGNESNFFIRDVTTGSKLPFRIRPGAATSTIDISSQSLVGIGSADPKEKLDVWGFDGTNGAIRIGNSIKNPAYEGTIRYSDLGVFEGYNGTNWVTFGGGGGGLWLENTPNIYFDTGDVAIGVDTPTAALHLQRSDETAKLLVEELGATGAQELLELNSNDEVGMRLANSLGAYWLLFNTTSGFALHNDIDLSAPLFLLEGTGDVTIQGVLTQGSSREIKDEFSPIAGDEILHKVANLAVMEWSYESDPAGVRHTGPMAEDFHALFGLGMDDSHLAPSDMAGIALAAIQELNRRIESKEERISQLEEEREGMSRENRELSERLSELDADIRELKAVIGNLLSQGAAE